MQPERFPTTFAVKIKLKVKLFRNIEINCYSSGAKGALIEFGGSGTKESH